MEGGSSKDVLVPEPSNGCDIFGDPKLITRVGDNYQANIPSLLFSSDDSKLINSQDDVKIATEVDDNHMMGLGLPIPLLWINQSFEKQTTQLGHHCFDSSGVHIDNSNWVPDAGSNSGKGHSLVPGPQPKQWSEIEEAGFLLGLYIFGKNFVQVNKFVGCESMGDIMSFYYCKFYKSRQYQRWTECCRKKSRKRICGNKIFTASRQQEFVSRLLSSVAEELQEAVLEISKRYAAGNISIEDYVFNLKSVVGMENFVKAVAIGKGKKDLTGPSVDISKSNQTLYACLDVPSGKAWSSLTTTAIHDFLTQSFRLSKAKSGDLFWEAVWPRLLARGWHSEQPKGYTYVARSKQPLVFLVPGVKKFSRRKLVKGKDYFDSVSDILSKVAKEPMLLELEEVVDQSGNSQVTVAAKLDDHVEHRDLVDEHRAYLKPRDTDPDIEYVSLTVIDTALATSVRGQARKVTQWPVKFLSTPLSGSQFEEIDNNIVEQPREESDSGDASCFEHIVSKSNALTLDHTISRSSTTAKQIAADVSKTAVTQNQLQNRKSASVRSVIQNGFVDSPSAVSKPKKLTVCSQQETSQHSISQRENMESSSYYINATRNGTSQMGLSQEKLASKNDPVNLSSKNYIGTNRVSLNNELQHENSRPRMIIDLNLPYISDNDLDGAPSIDLNDNNGAVDMEQETVINSRRHGTRNRPLTAKVLDAIADGFFEPTPKRKRGQSPSADCNVRSSHQTRASSNGILNIGFGAQMSDFEGNGALSANSSSNMLLRFQNFFMKDHRLQ